MVLKKVSPHFWRAKVKGKIFIGTWEEIFRQIEIDFSI